jgi:hypothetical protein
LAAHLINIASLYALFLAFNQTIELGPLVAGYAMGISSGTSHLFPRA